MPALNTIGGRISGLFLHARENWGPLKRNTASMLLADITGTVVSLISLELANKVFSKKTRAAEKWLGDKYIAPNLDKIEGVIGETGNFHTLDEATTEAQTPERKVKLLSRFGVEMALTGAVGFATAMAMHGVTDHRLGLKDNTRAMRFAARAVDITVHVGNLYIFNKVLSGALKPPKKIISGILQKCGISKESADRSVNYITNLEVPNIIGAAAGVGAIYTMGRHLDKLPGFMSSADRSWSQILAGAAKPGAGR